MNTFCTVTKKHRFVAFFLSGCQMRNRVSPVAMVAFVLLCWQASTARAQLAGTARLGVFTRASDAEVSGRVVPVNSAMVVSLAMQPDSSGASSNVRRHVVIGAVFASAAAVAVTIVELPKYRSQSAQSDCQSCVIVTVFAVPAVALGAVVAGWIGWITAERPHPTQQ